MADKRLLCGILFIAASLAAAQEHGPIVSRISWQPVDFVSRYEISVEIRTRPGVWLEIIRKSSGEEPFVDCPFFPGDYRFQISAFDRFGNSGSSTGWNYFEVRSEEEPVAIPAAAVRPARLPPPALPPPPPRRSAQPPRLPRVRRLSPSNGALIDGSYLKTEKQINFHWEPVNGANAYLCTVKQGDMVIMELVREPRFVFNRLGGLTNGDCFWQIEAVRLGAGGTIQRHGTVAESRFTLAVPKPEAPVVVNPGIIHGR